VGLEGPLPGSQVANRPSLALVVIPGDLETLSQVNSCERICRTLLSRDVRKGVE
jgi:hypothetical protein